MSSLTILIPTLNEPHYIPLYKRLKAILKPQIEKFYGRVKVEDDYADRKTTIGEKRNNLLAKVQTEYFVFIDSDDVISDNYLYSIFSAIDKNPDCVTFNGSYTCNGIGKQKFIIKLGERYEERNKIFYRWPNHLTPMRTSLVRHVKFPHITKTEDYIWSKAIRDMRLLKTSIHIEEELYWYQFDSKKPNYDTPRLRR